MPQPARRPCGANTRESREERGSIAAPASASIIHHATATTTTRWTKGSAHCDDTYQPTGRARPHVQCRQTVRRRYTNPLSLETSTNSGAGARCARALRKGRDVARVCACGALAAGVRCGIARGVPPQVMQRAATVAWS